MASTVGCPPPVPEKSGLGIARLGVTALPIVKLPPKPPRREDWLIRSEAARLIWAAWRNPEARHLARFILIGAYTGTRPGAVLRLKWLPSTVSGWIDLDHGLLYRKGSGQRETKKRPPPAPIHARLLPHLRRWRQTDAIQGAIHVINYKGAPVNKLRRSWRTACKAAGLSETVVPHSLRHTPRRGRCRPGRIGDRFLAIWA